MWLPMAGSTKLDQHVDLQRPAAGTGDFLLHVDACPHSLATACSTATCQCRSRARRLCASSVRRHIGGASQEALGENVVADVARVARTRRRALSLTEIG
jgi:hypothetical protein